MSEADKFKYMFEDIDKELIKGGYHFAGTFEDAVETIEDLEQKNKELRAALNITRGQWIHSIHAEQCLKTLANGE